MYFNNVSIHTMVATRFPHQCFTTLPQGDGYRGPTVHIHTNSTVLPHWNIGKNSFLELFVRCVVFNGTVVMTHSFVKRHKTYFTAMLYFWHFFTVVSWSSTSTRHAATYSDVASRGRKGESLILQSCF